MRSSNGLVAHWFIGWLSHYRKEFRTSRTCGFNSTTTQAPGLPGGLPAASRFHWRVTNGWNGGRVQIQVWRNPIPERVQCRQEYQGQYRSADGSTY
jgi:hypothetical protein